MTTISQRSVEQDLQIAYLAGLSNGQSPIEFMDKWNASTAQKHPFANNFSSNISGAIKGIATTAFGTLTYPLFRDGITQTFATPDWVVCSEYSAKSETMINILSKLNSFFKCNSIPLNFDKFISISNNFKDLCNNATANETDLIKMQAINYAGKVWETLSNNTLLIGASAVGLTALFAYSKMQEYTDNEIKAEESLKRSLSDKFEKIADRLTDLKGNSQAQECASRILLNQLQINNEIDNLQLPSLSRKKIKEMTQPVFEAAQKMQ